MRNIVFCIKDKLTNRENKITLYEVSPKLNISLTLNVSYLLLTYFKKIS